jgi:3-carboxy-cis,cis-muconate cycloisomerase
MRSAADRAARENRHLSGVLKQMPEITAHLSAAQIDELLDARNYLGSAQRFIARVVGDEDAHR